MNLRPQSLRERRIVHFALSVLSLVFMSGCQNERLKPKDFPRKERSQIVAPEPPQTAAAAAPRSDVDLPTENQQTMPEDAFRASAMGGDLEAVKAQWGSVGDVNAADPQGRTALQLAAFDGHTTTVDWLIEKGANVNQLDQFGRTALMYAATGANVDTVTSLLEAGADVNLADAEENFTALMFAAAEGQTDVVELLLASNAERSTKDADGETALDFATQNGHDKVVELLSR